MTDEELDCLALQLGQAYRRVKAIREWSECRTHLTDKKVDTILMELKWLKAHETVGSGIRLTD